MKNIGFLSENFQVLDVKFSIYLNRLVFVMESMCLMICAPDEDSAQTAMCFRRRLINLPIRAVGAVFGNLHAHSEDTHMIVLVWVCL